MEEWIKQGGFIAVIGILMIGIYYFKNKADQLTLLRDKDTTAYQVRLDKLQADYVDLLQDVLKTISQNTVAIDAISKAMDISLKLEKLSNGLRGEQK